MECLLLSRLLFKLFSHFFIYSETPPMSVTKEDFLVSSIASITPTLCAVSHQSFSSRSPYGLIESIVQHLFKWQTAWCSFTTGNGVNINATATKPVQNWKVKGCGQHAVQNLHTQKKLSWTTCTQYVIAVLWIKYLQNNK